MGFSLNVEITLLIIYKIFVDGFQYFLLRSGIQYYPVPFIIDIC